MRWSSTGSTRSHPTSRPASISKSRPCCNSGGRRSTSTSASWRRSSRRTEIHRRRIEGELAKTKLHLERLVRTDPLTELLNRRGMREAIEGHSRRSERDGLPVSAILIDIDDFKNVNDTLGHSIGDEVIRSVAEHVRASLRPADVAGRIGGDEFVALLPGATLSDASTVADRISQAVGGSAPQVGEVGVTVSMGVASVKPGTSSITDLLTRTEMLLRDSKQRGKNTVTIEVAAS